DRAHLLVVAAHRRAQRLRICAVAERGRAGEVAEEDRHDLAHLARRGRGGERCAAVAAEPETVGALVAAASANDHRPSLSGASASDPPAQETPTWHHGLIADWWANFNVGGPEIECYGRFVADGQPALDAGCGAGRLLLPWLRAGFDVDGCDVSADMVA